MSKELTHSIHAAITWMSRDRIQLILESHGFAVYDNETEDSLRDALRANVFDGTINPGVVLD